ncbi:unnamed protein product, partial [Prorocentrum cordatum]
DPRVAQGAPAAEARRYCGGWDSWDVWGTCGLPWHELGSLGSEEQGRWGPLKPEPGVTPAWRGWTLEAVTDQGRDRASSERSPRPEPGVTPARGGRAAEARTDQGRDRTSSDQSNVWSRGGRRAVGGAAGDGDRRDRGDEKYVPEWDGKSVPFCTYERRVKIFELNAAIPPSRRGGRLFSRLGGDAEAKMENLDPEALAVPDAQETLKVGTLVDGFVGELARNVGEEVLDFETRCETKIRELEKAMGEPLTKHLKAHYFLKKLRVGGDKESQNIAGVGKKLGCEKLRGSAKACLPRVSMPRKTPTLPPSADGGGGVHGGYLNRNRRRPGRAAGRGGGRSVHAVRGGQEGDLDEAAGDDGAAEHESVPGELLDFQAGSAAMMARAKKARAGAEEARDFYRGGAKGGSGANAERVKMLTRTLPCKRCGRLSRRKGGPECQGASGKDGGRPIAVVSQPVGEAEPTPEEALAFVDPRSALIAETRDELWLIVVDAACAKGMSVITVAGEREPYRFGPGSAIYSRAAVLVPMERGGKGVMVRLGLVGKDVPPLTSGGALKELEARVRVGEGEIAPGAAGRSHLPLKELSSEHMAMSALGCGPAGPGAWADEAAGQCLGGAWVAFHGRGPSPEGACCAPYMGGRLNDDERDE